MAYIGNTLRTAQPNYQIIDDISASFDGSTTTFALQVGGATPVPFPVSAQHCLISVGGVIQQPDPTGTDGFLLSGSNIVFSAAPSAGENFFGVVLAGADYINVGAEFPDGSVANPSITFDSDRDTGLYRKGANNIAITTNGTERVSVGTSEVVFNDGGNDIDFRIEGDTDSNLFFVDAGNERVGIGTTVPSQTLGVDGGIGIGNQLNTGTTGSIKLVSSGGINYIQSGQNTSNSSAAPLVFTNYNGFNEWCRIDSSGRLLVGTSSAPANTGNTVAIVQSGASTTKVGYQTGVTNSFTSITGATVGNETSVYLVTIKLTGTGNFYSTATYILNSAAYDKTFTQLGTASDHFNNGYLLAQLSSYSGTSSSVQVRRSNSGTATCTVHMLKLM